MVTVPSKVAQHRKRKLPPRYSSGPGGRQLRLPAALSNVPNHEQVNSPLSTDRVIFAHARSSFFLVGEATSEVPAPSLW